MASTLGKTEVPKPPRALGDAPARTGRTECECTADSGRVAALSQLDG